MDTMVKTEAKEGEGEYKALRMLDATLFARHLAEERQRMVLTMVEEPRGFRLTLHRPGDIARSSLVETHTPERAMQVAERALGRPLRFEEFGHDYLVRDWRDGRGE